MNKDLVRRTSEMLTKNPRLAHELFAPELAVQQQVLAQQLAMAFPDLALTIEHLIEEGDRLASRWTATGTHAGPFLGIAPTHARVAWTGTSMYRVAAGKIVETTTNWDAFDVVQQLRKAASAT